MILGAWCLSAFVLIAGYNSVLISYVTSPNAEPLIRSINDLTNTSSVKIVVDRGLGVDLGLSVSTSLVCQIEELTVFMKFRKYLTISILYSWQLGKVFSNKWETSCVLTLNHDAQRRTSALLLSSLGITFTLVYIVYTTSITFYGINSYLNLKRLILRHWKQ